MKKLFKSSLAVLTAVCLSLCTLVYSHAQEVKMPVDIKAKAAVLMDVD